MKIFTMSRNMYPKKYFEKAAWEKDCFVCGIDEVGRGCLAGPLVVAACILPQNTNYLLLKDSKIMTAEEREKAFVWIAKNCFYSTAIVSPSVIDKINIYQATIHAMRKAFMQLIETLPFDYAKLKYLLIDAVPLMFEKCYLHRDLEIYNFPKGETISTSIAAASIVAKVFRDKLMDDLAVIIPQFGFESHKGYGTKQHMQALKQHGSSILHRESFLSGLRKDESNDEQQQRLIF
jgi:ribonuclease HII